MSKINPSRAPKQLGDFGESLVNYDFIRKGYHVAVVDHVGADLICSKDSKRYAVSVKTRWFKKDSTESQMFNISNEHLDKLQYFSELFGMEPMFSLLVILSDQKRMLLFTIKVKEIKTNSELFRKTKVGYSLRFSDKNLTFLERSGKVSISSWENENIGDDIW
jgi:Holliday junction resolvase